MILQKFIAGPILTNCYLLADESTKQAVVIDPGIGASIKVLPAVKDLGLSVEFILNTHGHFDHVWDNAPVKQETGAKLLIHKADEICLSQQVPAYPLDFPFQQSTADDFLSPGQLILVGSLALEVLQTPGHTPGSVCFYEKTQGLLFTGDTLLSGAHGRSDYPGGNSSQLKQSLLELAKLPKGTRILSGHGVETAIGDELDWLNELE